MDPQIPVPLGLGSDQDPENPRHIGADSESSEELAAAAGSYDPLSDEESEVMDGHYVPITDDELAEGD